MKLTGNLKKEVDNISTKEGKKEAIRKAGMLLTDDELEKVSGGNRTIVYPIRGNSNRTWGPNWEDYCSCDNSYVGHVEESNGVKCEICGNCGKYISYDTY